MTHDLIQAQRAVKALGALLSNKPHSSNPDLSDVYFEWVQKVDKAHEDIRDTLARLDAALASGDAEPVAWRVRERPGFPWKLIDGDPERDPCLRGFQREPLYAAAPAKEPT